MQFPTSIQTLLQNMGWYGDHVLLAVEYQPDQEVHSLMMLEKEGEEVHIIFSRRYLQLPDLLSQLKSHSGLPILIGIQQRILVEAMIPQHESEVAKAILGVSVDDKNSFAYQEFPANKNQKLASLVRKSQLEEWMEPFEEFRDRVIYLNLSPGILGFLLPGMASYHTQTAYHWPSRWRTYLWQQGLVAMNGQEKYLISDQEVAEELAIQEEDLFLFGTAVQYFITEGKALHGWEETARHRHQLLQKCKLFKLFSWVLIGLVAGLLFLSLSNMILSSSNEQYRKQISSQQTLLNKLRAQQREIREQTEFLNRASQDILAPSSTSFLLDRLAQLRPDKMSFQKLTISPSQKEWDKIVGEQGMSPPPVYIQGQASEAQAITIFAQSLQSSTFIESAKLFQTEFDFLNQVHTFVITLHPNNTLQP